METIISGGFWREWHSLWLSSESPAGEKKKTYWKWNAGSPVRPSSFQAASTQKGSHNASCPLLSLLWLTKMAAHRAALPLSANQWRFVVPPLPQGAEPHEQQPSQSISSKGQGHLKGSPLSQSVAWGGLTMKNHKSGSRHNNWPTKSPTCLLNFGMSLAMIN